MGDFIEPMRQQAAESKADFTPLKRQRSPMLEPLVAEPILRYRSLAN